MTSIRNPTQAIDCCPRGFPLYTSSVAAGWLISKMFVFFCCECYFCLLIFSFAIVITAMQCCQHGFHCLWSLCRCRLIVSFLFAVTVMGIGHYAVLMLKLPLLWLVDNVALAAGWLLFMVFPQNANATPPPLLLAIHGAHYLPVDCWLRYVFSLLRLLSPLCAVAQCLPTAAAASVTAACYSSICIRSVLCWQWRCHHCGLLMLLPSPPVDCYFSFFPCCWVCSSIIAKHHLCCWLAVIDVASVSAASIAAASIAVASVAAACVAATSNAATSVAAALDCYHLLLLPPFLLPPFLLPPLLLPPSMLRLPACFCCCGH